MVTIAGPQEWAEQNFGAAELSDRRRTRRLVDSAAKIAAHPEKSFPQIFDWNDLRGFYGLCDKPQATLDAIQRPHRLRTREAMTAQPLVLVIHDTSELDFSSHNALQGTGPIGDDSGQGFLQHNTLAVVPNPRQVLGLAFQQLRVRVPAPDHESSHQRKTRERESDLWREGVRGVGKAPDGSTWVDVMDRAGDDYENIRVARELGHHILIRANQNRLVFLSEEQDKEGYLLDYARSLPSVGSDRVDIPGRGGRPPRTATVNLAGAAVWMPAPAGTPQRASQPAYHLWIIRIWEPQPPEGVEEPLEWLLLCSLPSETLAELKERRDWYCCRWMVEVYHDVEKNGCSMEERRFETAERMWACLAILAVVAVRVMQMRFALTEQPEAPATQVASSEEIEVIRRWLKQTSGSFTVRDFVRGVARLGGFLGRKCDRDPGVRALWRGYQRLQDMIAGFRLHRPSPNAKHQSARDTSTPFSGP